MNTKVIIIGGGSAGISVAARLRRFGDCDVTLVEPSSTHYYQPAWTLVGGGVIAREQTARAMSSVIPRGVTWLRDRVVAIDPFTRRVQTEGNGHAEYDFLVAAPGLELDWGGVPGLADALERPEVVSVYSYDGAPRTWQALQGFEGGSAVFTCPPMPIKCAGAPQKILYLAADLWRQRGLLARSRVTFGTATPAIFGIKEYAEVLTRVAAGYGIDVRLSHSLSLVDADRREATFITPAGDQEREFTVSYDLLHVVPPQRAPEFIRTGPLASEKDPVRGWIEVDKHTLQHVRHPEVFALGDATDTPNAKTGAAVRSQTPVLVANLRAAIDGKPLCASYGGYGACPLITGYRKLLLAEFDYTGKPTPSFPVIDTMKERYDMWLMKRYGLPWLYWNLMLRGWA
jgi:sulfide:quinone oxidoreductase